MKNKLTEKDRQLIATMVTSKSQCLLEDIIEDGDTVTIIIDDPSETVDEERMMEVKNNLWELIHYLWDKFVEVSILFKAEREA